MLPSRATAAPPVPPPHPAAPVPTPPRKTPDQDLPLLVDWITTRWRAGYPASAVRRAAAEWGMPAEVEGGVSAILQMIRGAPLPVGEVEYSKRDGGGSCMLVRCWTDPPDVHFDATDSYDLRSYPHRPTGPERRAAELLLRSGWSGRRILIDDIQAHLAGDLDWASFDDQDLNSLLAVLRQHAPFIRGVARRKGVRIPVEDLLQDVTVDLWSAWQTGRAIRSPVAFVRRLVRNKVVDHARRARVRPALMQESEFPLAEMPGRMDRDAARAREIIDAVRPRLSIEGRLALELSLGESTLADYMRLHNCSLQTARRHSVLGFSELSRLIREAQSRDDD